MLDVVSRNRVGKRHAVFFRVELRLEIKIALI